MNKLTLVNNKKFFSCFFSIIRSLRWEEEFVHSGIFVHLRANLRSQLSQEIDALFLISIERKRDDLVVVIVEIFNKLHRWASENKIIVFLNSISVILLNSKELSVS